MTKDKKVKRVQMMVLLGFYIGFVLTSYLVGFGPGKDIGKNFAFFAADILVLFPPAFVLVGLFMVWVDRKIIERYFGQASGPMGYVAAILLSCTTLYPFIVVLPMAAALMKKGGRVSIVLTYLGASAICRIPMSIFEASFLGLKFTLIRYVIALPLIILSSIFIEKLVGLDYYDRMALSENLD